MSARTIKCLIAMHGRHATVDIFAKHMPFPVICVASTDEDIQYAKDKGWEVTQYPNDRTKLFDKLQAGLMFAKDLEWDNLLCMGSDDIMCKKTIQYFVQNATYDFVGIKQCYLYDIKFKQLLLWMGYKHGIRHGEPAGAGRMLSRELLERMDWQLWGDIGADGVDYHSWKQVQKLAKNMQLLDIKKNFMLVDIKDDGSKNPLRKFKGCPQPPLKWLYERIPDSKNW